jgi:hypothetical protein
MRAFDVGEQPAQHALVDAERLRGGLVHAVAFAT